MIIRFVKEKKNYIKSPPILLTDIHSIITFSTSISYFKIQTVSHSDIFGNIGSKFWFSCKRTIFYLLFIIIIFFKAKIFFQYIYSDILVYFRVKRVFFNRYIRFEKFSISIEPFFKCLSTSYRI